MSKGLYMATELGNNSIRCRKTYTCSPLGISKKYENAVKMLLQNSSCIEIHYLHVPPFGHEMKL